MTASKNRKTSTSTARSTSSNTTTEFASLERNAIQALRQTGWGKDRIATQLGLSRSRVRRIVDDLETGKRKTASR